MATKDWKMIVERKDLIKWINNKLHILIEINKRNDIYKYAFSTFEEKDRYYETLKLFKTKSQALKFAKAYMKKH